MCITHNSHCLFRQTTEMRCLATTKPLSLDNFAAGGRRGGAARANGKGVIAAAASLHRRYVFACVFFVCARASQPKIFF